METINKAITINSRKYDGSIHRSWQATFIEQNTSLLKFVGKFDQEIKHQHIGVIRRGTISYEYYWLDRWYNVFRFHEPDGEFRNFYCNINFPPIFNNDVLDYVDLDIDVLVWKDFSYSILDLDEFEENAVIFNYPTELITKIQMNLKGLIDQIEHRKFPFDFSS